MKKAFSIFAFTAVLTTVGLYAQAHRDHATAPVSPSPQQQTASGKMPDACRAMMAKRDQMMADMKAMDAKLDQKVAAMNSAAGPAKVDAMAAVINELVSQRRQMQNMMSMNGAPMMGMMGGGNQRAMMDCPMMQSTPGSARAQ
ncbi:MAG: hypothetical protein M1482_10700 [Chloroflexi bacterium]|nr:hypothetical protein [Chloroflexota bacterium]